MTSDLPFAKHRSGLDRTRQIAPQIVEYLREKILELELAPGTSLSRLELQKQFGLSQTPVRDALMRLEEEGLVTVYPQYATLVSKIDINLARQSHFMRRAVEQEIVHELASRPNRRFVERLTLANEKLKTLVASSEYGDFLRRDRDFHYILYEEAGLEDIWPVVRRHSGHIDRLRRLNLPNVGKARVVDNHHAIIEGIAMGNPERAEEAMKVHLSGTLSMVDSIVERYPDFVQR
ncbi:MAG TPA: GntR family transcriptional regulator [Pararhizobium sp.]|uniref:GntR family transcriptional regulator n=1 Tax=Pararhizobium sp. TaxID=1977563 RepID=UPI002CA2B09C|nr:GntR family transcriptional regulator [Pararhizobium sp.]HTO31684.1 GntR family transcriptional regulator [Pararhizobium sp.]